MRMVGEKNFAALSQAKKQSGATFDRDYNVECHECGFIAKFCLSAIRKIDRDNWLCGKCKKKSKDEVTQALIATALRRKKLKVR